MTKSQVSGMYKFHKRAYAAYKSLGDGRAKDARRHMIKMYLKLRSFR